MNLEQEQRRVAEMQSQLVHWEQTLKAEQQHVATAAKDVERAGAAQNVLQHLAQAVQQHAHQRIASVVSSCLSAVFGEEAYVFRIVFERKRGRTEAHLRFQRGDMDVDPLTASGGGVVDVAAFALRVACLTLHRPRLSKVLVLDEPFRFVSEQYQPNVRSMLEQLAEEMRIQFVVVTHMEGIATGKIIDV